MLMLCKILLTGWPWLQSHQTREVRAGVLESRWCGYCMIWSVASWVWALSLSLYFPSQISEHYNLNLTANQRYITPHTSHITGLSEVGGQHLVFSLKWISVCLCGEEALWERYWSRLGVYHSAELGGNFSLCKVLSCIICIIQLSLVNWSKLFRTNNWEKYEPTGPARDVLHSITNCQGGFWYRGEVRWGEGWGEILKQTRSLTDRQGQARPGQARSVQ